MEVLNSAIKQNANLDLKEINAGLNQFSGTDIKSLIAKSISADLCNTDVETGPSTRKNSFQANSLGVEEVVQPLSVVDILTPPEDENTDAFSNELSKCLKLY